MTGSDPFGDETDAPAAPSALWGTMFARAVVAAVVAVIVAFTPGHTLTFDLVAFGALAFGTGVFVLLGAIRAHVEPGRRLVLARGVVSVLAGALAITLAALPDTRSTTTLIWIVAAWAFTAGALWVLVAWRTRPRRLVARESAIAGPITLVLGVLVAIVPPDLHQEYGGLEQVEGAMTATIQVGGLVGGYAAILAVLLAVEAFTLRGVSRRASTPAADGRPATSNQNRADTAAAEVD